MRTAKDGLKGKQKKRYHNDASCLLRLKEDGTVFRSYRNGDLITLTPESSVCRSGRGSNFLPGWCTEENRSRYHHSFGLASPSRSWWEATSNCAWTHTPLGSSVTRPTHKKHQQPSKWRSRKKLSNVQAMYGVIHGGTNPTLRKISVDFLSTLPFQVPLRNTPIHNFRDLQLEAA